MNCKSVQIYLSAYLDGELRGPESLQVREHLGACSDCRAEEQQLRALKQMLQGLPTYTPAKDFEDRLVANVMQRAERRRVFSFNLDWKLTSGLVAAASIAAVALFQVTERTVPSTPSGEPTVINDIDFSSDQMLMAGSDPLSGVRYAISSAYAKD